MKKECEENLLESEEEEFVVLNVDDDKDIDYVPYEDEVCIYFKA